jgi:hypothetical protein
MLCGSHFYFHNNQQVDNHDYYLVVFNLKSSPLHFRSCHSLSPKISVQLSDMLTVCEVSLATFQLFTS